ncbi:MAG: hypothetical protein KAW56_14400 [Candidatus Marinimicrobia bacterium]|nr:hypothetical protein [Candidatus Neomarinimicrobiota bacterium]
MMILNRSNRKRIRELLKFHNEVCNLFKNSKNKELLGIFLEVKSACDDIPVSIFTVPDATVQPDQILKISNQPQG